MPYKAIAQSRERKGFSRATIVGNIAKPFGYSVHNVPRYRCCNGECKTKTFMLEYRYKAYEPGVKEQVVDMAINGSGIRG